MTGPKEKKGGGSKQQQQSGGALFPRLHVAETKRSGPRAPPRNKMALYEQFTIPSHTFKASPLPLPLNSNRMVSTPPLNMVYQPIQPQVPSGSYDSRYSTYTPVTYRTPISPAMAYMPIMNVPQYGYGGQGLVNISSGNPVVDGVTELQRVPLGASMPTPSPRSVDHSRQSGASKKGKEDDDFAVPTYSSATHGSSQTRPSRSAQVHETSAGQHKGRESVKDKQLRTSVHQRRNRLDRTDVTSVDQTDNRSCQTGSGQCVTVTTIDNAVGSGEPRNSYGEVQQVCEGEPVVSVSEGEPVVSVSEVEQETGHKLKDSRYKDASKTSEPAAVARDTLQHGGNLWGVPEQECQSSESSQNHSGQESETEPRRVTSDETKSSTLDNVPAVTVTPRDVIAAIGQQEFWKAHNIIMRQQKLFSEQVYELHRITEVQLMIAKSPSSILYVATVELEEEEEVEEDAPAPASPAAEVPEVSTRCLEQSSARKAGNDRRHAVETIPNKPVHPVVKPPQQSFVPGNPYEAYPFVNTPWAARMGSPYMYVPYPAPYPPSYGIFPVTGVDMAMYAQHGVIQGARYPALAATNMPSWGSQDPMASAWYGSQQVPVMGATGTAAIAALEPGRRLVRVDTSRASSQAQTSNLNKQSDRQGGDHPHAVAEQADNAGQPQENSGWAKGWGMNEERQEGRDENELQNSGSGRVNCPEREVECQKQDGARGPFPPHGGAKSGSADLADKGIEEVRENGVERDLAGGSAERRALQERSSKRTHAEGLEPDRIPWFSVIPPPLRNRERSGVIKVVPRPLGATPESTASILQSIQRERRQL